LRRSGLLKTPPFHSAIGSEDSFRMQSRAGKTRVDEAEFFSPEPQEPQGPVCLQSFQDFLDFLRSST
jgi:hypothetical protein